MLELDRVQTGLYLSEQTSWRYSRDRPVFGSIITLTNPVGMCDMKVGSGGNIDW